MMDDIITMFGVLLIMAWMVAVGFLYEQHMKTVKTLEGINATVLSLATNMTRLSRCLVTLKKIVDMPMEDDHE